MKINKENEFKQLIDIVKNGSTIEVKVAQKKIEKIFNALEIPRRKNKDLFLFFVDEIKNFDKIKDIDHQYYFINTLKYPFIVLGGENFEDWTEFILKLIQHSSGKIRQAAINAVDWLVLMNLNLDLSDTWYKKSTNENKKQTLNDRERFGNFVLKIENLLDEYHLSKYNRYKYVDSLPVGIYKSLNKLIFERLLRTEYQEKVYLDFLKGK